jgi:hypothetical protein
MEERGCQSIDSYEAQIQAWLRTATMEGMREAEAVAAKVLEDPASSGARLLTFHPIFAAWLHSRHQDSPGEIKVLIDRLTDVGRSHSHLTPDGRMMGALIAAHVFRQTKLLSETKNKEKQEDESSVVSSLVESAALCSGLLEDHCRRFEQSMSHAGAQDVFVDTTMFRHCILAWRNVYESSQGDAAGSSAEDDIRDKCLDELCRVLNLFERAISAAATLDNLSLRSNDKASIQLSQFMTQGPLVYSSFVTALQMMDGEVSAASVKKGSYSATVQCIDMLERVIRRTGEFCEFDQTEQVKWFYGDGFDYRVEDLLPPPPTLSKTKFLAQTVSALYDIIPHACADGSASAGDLARILLLIREITAAHSEETPSTQASLERMIEANLRRLLRDSSSSSKSTSMKVA